MGNPFEEMMQELKNIRTIVTNGSGESVNTDPVYLKADKAAEFLSISKNALTVMVHKRQLPYIKKMGKLYFLKSELIEWLESGRVEAGELNPEDLLISSNKKTA